VQKQEILQPREAARLLGIRLDSVYSAIWAGKLAAIKQDGRWLIPASAIEARAKSRADANGQ